MSLTTRPLRAALVACVLATGLVTAGTGAAAPAAGTTPGPATLDGVRTSLLTNPETTALLVRNKIGIEAVGGIRSAVVPRHGRGVSLRFRFPITTGSVDLATLAGTISHSGGLKVVNRANGSSLTVTDFVIDTTQGVLTAAVGGDASMRVPLLKLDLSDITVRQDKAGLRVINVRTRLTATAAGALNATLGTTLFAEDVYLGNANVLATVAR